NRIQTINSLNGRHEVSMRLHPDQLGEVRLTLTLGGGGNQISARFQAETELARQAMSEGREQLRAALEQKGFSLQSLDGSKMPEPSSSHSDNGQRDAQTFQFQQQNFNLASNSGERRFASGGSGGSNASRGSGLQDRGGVAAVETAVAATETRQS